MAQLVKALRYKSEGRGFIVRISFSCNMALGLTKPLTEMSINAGFRSLRFTLEQATKAHRGSRGIDLLFL